MRISDWSSDVCSSDLLGVCGDRCLDIGGVAHVDKAEAQTGRLRAYAREQAVAAAVEVVAGDDVRTGWQAVEQGRGRRQPGRERIAVASSFQIGDAALVGKARRILRTRILEALMDAG